MSNDSSPPGVQDNGRKAGVSPLNEGAHSFRSQVGPLLFLTLIFFLNFIARLILAPLMPIMEVDLAIGHSQAGSFFLLISIGYFITLLGSGFVSSRLTHRKTIILSSVVVGAALLGLSLCRSLWTIRLGLLVLGLAAGIYLPSGIATLTALISSRHWGKAIAIHELAPNVSFLAAPLVAEGIMECFSWRGVLALMGGASLLVGIAYARYGKGGEFPGEAPSPGSIKILMGEPAFWIMMVLFSLGISGSLGIYAMLPLYLVAGHGMERNWANTLVALSRISGLGISFVSGWATDRLGPRRTLIGVLILTGLATVLLGVTSGTWVLVCIFLQPMLAVCFFPAGFAALSRVGPPKVRNVTVSLTLPFAFMLGGGAIPTGIGILGDAGSLALGISLVGGLILLGALLCGPLKLSE
jgi:NNP family nitrate/nitrite transporter-like MFS transporter